MPRFYVHRPDGKWNIFSTITDSYVYEDLTLEDIKRIHAEEFEKDLKTLLTNNPSLNVMSYEEANERIEAVKAFEEAGEDTKAIYRGCIDCVHMQRDTCPDAYTETAKICIKYIRNEADAQGQQDDYELQQILEILGVIPKRIVPDNGRKHKWV